MPPERTHLTPKAVADQLGVRVETILRAIKRGDLAAVNIGSTQRRTWRIAKSSLAEFLSARSNFRGGLAKK